MFVAYDPSLVSRISLLFPSVRELTCEVGNPLTLLERALLFGGGHKSFGKIIISRGEIACYSTFRYAGEVSVYPWKSSMPLSFLCHVP